jgi:hypothetical protein
VLGVSVQSILYLKIFCEKHFKEGSDNGVVNMLSFIIKDPGLNLGVDNENVKNQLNYSAFYKISNHMGDSIADLVIALFCGSRHRLAFFI